MIYREAVGFVQIFYKYLCVCVLVWVNDLASLDCEIGIFVPNYIYYQPERSGGQEHDTIRWLEICRFVHRLVFLLVGLGSRMGLSVT